MAKTFFLFFLLLAGCAATNSPQPDTKQSVPDTSLSSNQMTVPAASKPLEQFATTASNETEIENIQLSRKDITKVQKQLSALGYKPGVADGIMGKNTMKAIMKFQKDNNLAETGKGNRQTIRMLEQKISEQLGTPGNTVQSTNAIPTTPPNNTQVDRSTVQTQGDGNQTEQDIDQSNKRIIVPGGIDSIMLNKLWKVAKTKCYDLRYTVANEDRETGNLVCVFETDAGQNMMLVNFDSEGFLVTVKGVIDNIPILGGIFKARLNEHKAQMDSVLKEAAGIKR